MDDVIQENPAIAIELLRQMKRIRLTEEAIAERYPAGKMRCPTHLCIGQEAIAAAVGGSLRTDDFVVSTHRAHGHYLAKGGDLNKMLAEIYGKRTGCSAGKGGSMHLIDRSVGFMGSTAIVGGTVPIGVGLGLSIQAHQTDQVSCIFLGDAAIEEGVFYESANFATLKRLPVLFICENNLYSVYSPLKVRQPADRQIYQLIEALGIPSEQIDGNDVLTMYQRVSLAIQTIRQGNGPYFLECHTYRWREHCGPNFDNDLGYRTEEEYCQWKQADPIVRLESRLLESAIISQPEIQNLESIIRQELIGAFEYAENAPPPEEQEAFRQVYCE